MYAFTGKVFKGWQLVALKWMLVAQLNVYKYFISDKKLIFVPVI
jgi:hypothetical protein